MLYFKAVKYRCKDDIEGLKRVYEARKIKTLCLESMKTAGGLHWCRTQNKSFTYICSKKNVASNTSANKTVQLRWTQTESSSDDAQDRFAVP